MRGRDRHDEQPTVPHCGDARRRHLFDASFRLARRIDAAVAAVLAAGRPRPVDLGGVDGTEAVTRAVVGALQASDDCAVPTPG